jgi:molybdopterin/thiamine biosynthesis adenylyltransferase
MNDDQLLRYSRHILLPELGVEGQEQLLASHALIVGAGGLGSPAALYLAAAGVGRITICDADRVDLTNLQRQIVHRTRSIGQLKVDSAKETLTEINPTIEITALQARLEGDPLRKLVAGCDIVLDCCDNFATRHAVNRACVEHLVPLVSGAAIRFDGQISVFDLRLPESPCYACLFAEDAQSEELRCAVMGVFAPLTGIIGTMQAAEAIKVLTATGSSLSGRLLILDALTMDWRSMRLARDRSCRVCSDRPE